VYLKKFLYLLFAILCFSAPFSLKAQWKGVNNLSYFDERPLHFGFYLGLNTMDYRFSHYNNIFDNPVLSNPANSGIAQNTMQYIGNKGFRTEVYPPAPGFSVGGVVNFRLGRDFDFRFTPGMSLGSRHLIYSVRLNQTVLNMAQTDSADYTTTQSYYIDIPIGIRYKGFRHHNVRPYIYLGTAFRRDLATKKRTQSIIHVGQNSAYAEVAMGLDSYLEYFRLTGELRFSYGLNNLIKHDATAENTPYYGYILKSVNSNILTLIFYFE
jgi:hypothetical protein